MTHAAQTPSCRSYNKKDIDGFRGGRTGAVCLAPAQLPTAFLVWRCAYLPCGSLHCTGGTDAAEEEFFVKGGVTKNKLSHGERALSCTHTSKLFSCSHLAEGGEMSVQPRISEAAGAAATAMFPAGYGMDRELEQFCCTGSHKNRLAVCYKEFFYHTNNASLFDHCIPAFLRSHTPFTAAGCAFNQVPHNSQAAAAMTITGKEDQVEAFR